MSAPEGGPERNWPPEGLPPGPSPDGRNPYGGYPPPPPPGQVPLGRRPLTPVDIRSYAAPKPRAGVLLALVAAAVVVGLVFAAAFLQPRPPPGSTPPTPTTRASAQPGLPFTLPGNANVRGRWEILGQDWEPSGVTVQVRLYADQGVLSYSFVALTNNGAALVPPQPSGRDPELTRGVLQEGETVTGYVFLPLPRGPATLILRTAGLRQISALPIRG